MKRRRKMETKETMKVRNIMSRSKRKMGTIREKGYRRRGVRQEIL